MWLGDCGAILSQGGDVAVIGETITKRAEESSRARKVAEEKKVSSAAPGVRAQFLEHLRAARGRVNSGNYWLFTPDKRAAAHAQRRIVKAEAGALLLLASDGFLALAANYDAYDAAGLIAAARARGLAVLGEELRAIENDDASGDRFARFKKSDDATALLLEIQ
jgi:serine/threonine protein phosphatase PrpC